ncbi:hypothetical protein N9B47_02555, partial [bacterium]|nr:hypothetical protein [bacterium]MDA7929785.1 hypothetical protein [Akkermansiaceae bacterium]
MIIEPLDCRTEDPVGGKARSLASLTQAGFEIPDWFIVTPDDYQLPPLNGLHAVRSSAMSEDGSENSFAGQFDSFLNISPDDVEVHIEKVRQSGTSSHLETYARTREVEIKGRVSVIVQKMVDAKFAGVAFGADPITGERAISIVSA